MFKVEVGQLFPLPPNPILGVPSAVGEILEVHPWGYTVHIIGDPVDEFGPVNKQGDIISYY